jgi:dolichol-phosphate mannosyltransferase
VSQTPHASRVLVVIPTFNEVDNVAGIVRRVRTATPQVDVLVVDDASPDGTGALADKLTEADPRVQVLHRLGKQGLGVAYLQAFGWGLQHGYDVLVQMDADGSHLPEQLPRLLSRLDQADMVLGSRWVPGGEVANWPRSRQLLSRAGNTFTRLALALPLRDCTGGYRVFRRATLEGLDLDSVSSQGYCFQVDIARRAVQSSFSVVEVPITFVEREHGSSKMDGAIVREAFWRVSGWGLARLSAPVLAATRRNMRAVLARAGRS